MSKNSLSKRFFARFLLAFTLITFNTILHGEETLYIPFDGSTNGIGKNGTITPTSAVGKTTFAPGKKGQALIAGPTYGLLKYPTSGIVTPAQGSVAMWVKSVDWSSTEAAFHVFFQTLGQNGLVLYKYFENRNLLMLVSQNMATGPYFSSGLGSDWKPGEWHHIGGTWSNEGVLLYIDGTPVSSSPSFALLPQALDKEFSIGDSPWTTSRTSSSLVDEVRIYNHALSSADFKNLFLGQEIVNLPTPPKILSVNDQSPTTTPPPSTPPPPNNSDTLTSSIPISSSIPTKILLTGNNVSIADHQVEFAGSSLPTKMIVESNSFLASPVSIVLTQNNQRTVLAASNFSISQPTTGDIPVAQSRLTGGPVALLSNSTVERDGLITFQLALPEGATIPAEAELSVEIPLNAAAFQYRIRWQNGARDLVETLKNTSNIDITSFVPYYWLGNNNNGLFWFSDVSRNWPSALASDAIRIDRNGSTLLFKQKIKAAGQTIPSTWKYRFGLQMTPVRKLPPSWRAWRLTPAANSNMEIIWPTPTTDSLKYYGYPEAADAKTFTDRVARIKNNKRLVLSYLTPSFISTGAPEWATHKNLWMSGIFDSTSQDVRAMGGTLAGVTPTSNSWQTFFTNKSAQFQNTYQLNGFYFDNAQLYGLYNPQINLGYTKDNIAQKEFPVFEYRELFKRVIEASKKDKPDSKIIIHSSGHLAFPVVSLADAYVDGEQFRDAVQDNYLDVLGLDQIRAEFIGRQWGMIPIFLPQFNATHAAKVEPTRGMMGLLMLHDILVWPQWCNLAEVNKALNALDRYSYVSSNFASYFDQIPPASTSSPNILVSSYQKSATDQLLVGVNIIKQPVSAEVCLTKPGTYQFTNWLTNQNITNTKSNCFNLNVGVQDYALVRAVSTQ